MQHIKRDPIVRSDNKVRLSADVLIKAQAIADEWGLQNAKAAVEAVFRKYADDYQYGRQPQFNLAQPMTATQFLPQIHAVPIGFQPQPMDLDSSGHPLQPDLPSGLQPALQPISQPSDAASELDGLLGL